MKVVALYDADGSILAATTVDPEDRGVIPVAGEGEWVDTFEIPEHATDLGLDEICTSFRVDPETRRLRDDRTDSSS